MVGASLYFYIILGIGFWALRFQMVTHYYADGDDDVDDYCDGVGDGDGDGLTYW